jgi:outer membrane lipoprotein-sorting protein
MALSPLARHRARYLVPAGAAAITAAIVVIPPAASGAVHPNLPARTAAQLLASLEQSKMPEFSGTVVETARLGLPNIGDSSLVQAASPSSHQGLMQIVTLLTGSHTAQLAYGGPDKQRVAIFLSDLSEMDVVHNGSDIWTYSSDSNSVTHNTLESDGHAAPEQDATAPVNPDKVAEEALAKIDPSTAVTVDRTAEVAGRSAYQLDLTPRDSNTLVGSVRIALDSATSMPLRVQIWSRGNTSSPAFEVGFTSLSFSPPSDSTFDFTTPPTATTQPLPFTHMFSAPLGQSDQSGKAAKTHKSEGSTVLGHNWTSVLVEHVSDSPVASPVQTTATKVLPATGKVVQPGPQQGPSLSQELDQLGTRVAGGHLITTTLLTIFLTDDNRILIGAVTPSYIEQLAASKAAQ